MAPRIDRLSTGSVVLPLGIGRGGDGKPCCTGTEVYGDRDILPRGVISRKLSVPNAERIVIIHNLGIAMIVHTNKVANTNKDWRLGTNELRFSFEGVYQYAAAGKLESQRFLMPIVHDATTRRLSSLPIQPDDGRWKRVMIEFQ